MNPEDIFAAIANENADWAAQADAEAAAAAKAKPVKDGLRYLADEQDENGHAISVYQLVVSNRILFYVLVDNFAEVPVPAGIAVPAGVTTHAIRLASADRTRVLDTNGVAARAPHEDGTHIDGQTVQQYVYPRLPRLVAELYGTPLA